jgi:hypothetical protein
MLKLVPKHRNFFFIEITIHKMMEFNALPMAGLNHSLIILPVRNGQQMRWACRPVLLRIDS